ncbi:HopJ type III effector protein [Colwellia sp. 4_MG-2023]|uniref:HopJ type III effector protein n=1 Tax=unclassified Colwellia TaxID=196834 RepID=UPI001C094A60|nr:MULTISPECIES: HopJ type III effector protein [unclassified Colwellia]MBU2925323.1 HopJ type III effector protein [Colwellia sp. C2M11]MDO6508574.1 HopJ type III effector protein [Colwellia sp. 5_MG-2023]MDO6557210.1 HopJ type III effector protein [Colwellia sp. 4_MG-2023]MDO6650753.1 HopJ type III effector protein [Colwellia sp. 3_MG-2023]MDO6663788.1 HopJ type III effector protein [Colwellia sp. 2_MG-2023]
MQENNTNSLSALLTQIKQQSATVEFEQVMQVIKDSYNYQPTSFTNGELVNQAGTNEGSCKIFYFAQLNELNQQQTLACFGRYYREDVLENPLGDDHGNIRNFIKTGWQGIKFDAIALALLPSA